MYMNMSVSNKRTDTLATLRPGTMFAIQQTIQLSTKCSIGKVDLKSSSKNFLPTTIALKTSP